MKRISIELEDYDAAAHLWVKDVFKKIHFESEIYDKFERAIGIKYEDTKNGYIYNFVVENEKKFLISTLKYSIKFQNI
jgi:hypothetical protein